MTRIYCNLCGGTLTLSDFYTKSMFCEKCKKRYEVVSLKKQNVKKEEADYLSKILLVNKRNESHKCLYCGGSYDMVFSTQSRCVKCGKKKVAFWYFIHFFNDFVSQIE